MNSWLVFILAVLVVHYLLDLGVSWLNIRVLSPDLPAEFSDIYDTQKYRQAQNYTRATTLFSLVENSAVIIVTVTFLLGGGFNYIDGLARSFDSECIGDALVYSVIL